MSSSSNNISTEPVETRKEETFDCIEDYAEPVRHRDGDDDEERREENEDKVGKEMEEVEEVEDEEHEHGEEEHELDKKKESEEEENLVKPETTEQLDTPTSAPYPSSRPSHPTTRPTLPSAIGGQGDVL